MVVLVLYCCITVLPQIEHLKTQIYYLTVPCESGIWGKLSLGSHRAVIKVSGRVMISSKTLLKKDPLARSPRLLAECSSLQFVGSTEDFSVLLVVGCRLPSASRGCLQFLAVLGTPTWPVGLLKGSKGETPARQACNCVPIIPHIPSPLLYRLEGIHSPCPHSRAGGSHKGMNCTPGSGG